jgi:hypothetical protein
MPHSKCNSRSVINRSRMIQEKYVPLRKEGNNETLNGLLQLQFSMIVEAEFISTHNARYFPSKLTESVDIGFPRSLLCPILFQSLMSHTTVVTWLPVPIMNTDIVKSALFTFVYHQVQ